MRLRMLRPTKTGLLNLVLVLLIFLVAAGLYLQAASFGIVPEPRGALAGLPYVGAYFRETPRTPETLTALEAEAARKAEDARARELEEARAKLAEAEAALEAERQRLAQWRDALAKREEALEAREREARDRDRAFARLVAYYASMRPQDAARILAQQEDLVVVEIFRRMEERQVSAILAQMDPQIAATILRKMANP